MLRKRIIDIAPEDPGYFFGMIWRNENFVLVCVRPFPTLILVPLYLPFREFICFRGSHLVKSRRNLVLATKASLVIQLLCSTNIVAAHFLNSFDRQSGRLLCPIPRLLYPL